MRLIDADEIKRAFIGNRYGTKAIEYVIDDIPTAKAIPIEWFKKEIDWHLETVTYGAEVYQWVLNRWYEDKENWEKRK